jgi:hypothetical protein
MKPLRSWRFKGEFGYVVVEESEKPGKVSLVISGDSHREWLDESSFRELVDLSDQIEYGPVASRVARPSASVDPSVS